jgi:hypothetical protein
MAPNGLLELHEKDYLPLADCAFQHWGEREREPFTHLRPLTPDASERAWRRTSAMAARQWAESADGNDVLDLRLLDDWSEASGPRLAPLSRRRPRATSRRLLPTLRSRPCPLGGGVRPLAPPVLDQWVRVPARRRVGGGPRR